jgi:hypothetical protein
MRDDDDKDKREVEKAPSEELLEEVLADEDEDEAIAPEVPLEDERAWE